VGEGPAIHALLFSGRTNVIPANAGIQCAKRKKKIASLPKTETQFSFASPARAGYRLSPV